MYAIEKIVDISLRAISPGINALNTAIQCINILGILLSMMSKESSNACRMSLDEENIELLNEIKDYVYEKTLGNFKNEMDKEKIKELMQ